MISKKCFGRLNRSTGFLRGEYLFEVCLNWCQEYDPLKGEFPVRMRELVDSIERVSQDVGIIFYISRYE